MPTAQTFNAKLFQGVPTPGNLDDALLRLLLLASADAAPASDLLTYLRLLVGGRDDIAVSWIAQRLNDATEQLSR